MGTVEYTVPDMDAAEWVDLANTLLTLNGVAHVSLDNHSHVLVEYDGDYSNGEIIKSSIVGSGYAVSEQHERT